MLTHLPSGKTIAEQIEWMRTSSERSCGLLKYAVLPEKYAAIFLLPLWGFFPMVHTLGMKFSIDILFLDREKKVLFISRATEPGRIIMPWRWLLGGCRYLLELPAGGASLVSAGDKLSWGAI